MAAETARVTAEQKLQALRADLEQLRLHNDVILPAQAQRKAEELKARGQAAPVIEAIPQRTQTMVKAINT